MGAKEAFRLLPFLAGLALADTPLQGGDQVSRDVTGAVVSAAKIGKLDFLHYPAFGRTHLGVDLLADEGNHVHPFAEGIVVAACPAPEGQPPSVGTCGANETEDGAPKYPDNADLTDLGYAVMVRHPGIGRDERDVYSIYLHMQEPTTQKIDSPVTTADVLGKVGKTGAAHGTPHVHFEIRYFASWFHRWANGSANIYCPGDCSKPDSQDYKIIIKEYENPLGFPQYSCRVAVGHGASEAQEAEFKAAYDGAGGRRALGCPAEPVRQGFTSFRGAAGTYQTLKNGLLEFHSGKAYALVRPVSDKWRKVKDLLGYPTSQLSEEKTASTGTRYRFQQFESGALEWHLSGPKAGQVFEVHGAILERWAKLGYADWSGGLPTADEGRPGLGSGLGRMSQFEGGYIWWKQGAPEAVETEPPISDLYVRLRGGAGWLGFPRSRVRSAADGSLRQDFEHGYIQVPPGRDPEARRSDCIYELREDSVDVRPTGALLAQVRATAPKECPFEARSDVPWIRVLMVTHIGTSGRVQFTVGANSETAPRTGTLTVGDRTVTVRQTGAQPRP